MVRAKRRVPTPTPSPTTIASLSEDLLHQILLRLPSPASVARVAAASRFLRDAVSGRGFCGSYLSAHASSSLLGFFASGGDEGPSRFQPVPQVGTDRDLAAALRGGDFLLTNLDQAPRWHLEDCLDGRLLLSRDDEALSVCSPLPRRPVVYLRRPRLDSSADAYFAHCLLRGHGGATSSSFRVLSVQHRNGDGGGLLQAAEYDSSTGRWRRFHPWMDVRPEARGRAMHAAAAGLVFWGHGHGQGTLLLLDSITMSFSGLHLPSSVVHLKPSRYSIGETGDGVCCLIAAITDFKLQTWVLSADNKTWEFKADILVRQAIGRAARVRQVCAVGSGVAFLRCDSRGPLLIIDINKWRLSAEMKPNGSIVYPFQMPWAVTASTSGTRHIPLALGIFSSDEHANSITFQPLQQVWSDPSLRTALGGGDFFLTKLKEAPEWRLRDSFNGLLLLSRNESLIVYNPISRCCVIKLCRQQNDASPSGAYFADCLVQGRGDNVLSFRVITLQQQQHKCKWRVRAVEYDPTTGQWQPHQWMYMYTKERAPQLPPMHAAGLGLWKLDGTSVLLLESCTMKLSHLFLPYSVGCCESYAIGQTEEGGCLLATLEYGSTFPCLKLKVWLLHADKKTWKFHKETQLSDMFGFNSPFHVKAVTTGLVILSYMEQHRSLAIDLNKMCVTDEFAIRTGLIYPFEIPRSPIMLVANGTDMINNTDVEAEPPNLLSIEETEGRLETSHQRS